MERPKDPTLEHIDAALAEHADAQQQAAAELERVWAQFCVDDCF